jgi:hypothetical protein
MVSLLGSPLARRKEREKPYENPKKEDAKEEFSNKGPKCHHCNDWGYIRRDCAGFKAWVAKRVMMM